MRSSTGRTATRRIIVHCAVWRKNLRQITPLTTGAQDVHQAVHHRTHIGAALPPPGRGGEISGAITAHSSSVRSLGYLRWSRLYLGRFFCVHIGGPSLQESDQLLLITNIPMTPEVLGRTLSTEQQRRHWYYQSAGGVGCRKHCAQ